MGFSVIIPTRNSAKTLPHALSSVSQCRSEIAEIVVVDAMSTDGTPEIASSFGAKVLSLRSGKTEARKKGLNQSSGEHILLLDSDQVLGPDGLAELTEVLQHYDMVIIPEGSMGTTRWEKLLNAQREAALRSGRALPRAFRRQVLESKLPLVDTEEAEDRRLLGLCLEQGFSLGVAPMAYILNVDGSVDVHIRKLFFYGAGHAGKVSQGLKSMMLRARAPNTPKVSSDSGGKFPVWSAVYKAIKYCALLYGLAYEKVSRALSLTRTRTESRGGKTREGA